MGIIVTMASNTVSNEYANSFNYRFVKLMQGTFHQGNPRFGETAGLQCVCNSLMSIVWSSIKQISYWRPQDLDNILINGDILYKRLNVFSSHKNQHGNAVQWYWNNLISISLEIKRFPADRNG